MRVSVPALQRVLVLVEKRETRYRVQWYYSLFEATMRSLNREPRTGALPSAESIHGGLLALGELLMHTGEFLLARWVVVAVLRLVTTTPHHTLRNFPLSLFLSLSLSFSLSHEHIQVNVTGRNAPVALSFSCIRHA